jgi:hypothetical protein
MRKLLATTALLLLAWGAHAQPTDSIQIKGQPSTIKLATVTRPANATPYAAGQAVCASVTVDCVPMAFPVGAGPGGTGLVHGVQLAKSAVGVTNANFTVLLYQSLPTIAGIHDASALTPLLADIQSGAYRGAAVCTAPTVNGNNAYYQCTLANTNGIVFVSDASAQIYAVLQANGAYTPASGETFTVSVTAKRD